jgi:hypothetical protein
VNDYDEGDAEVALLSAQLQMLEFLAQAVEDAHMMEAAILAHRRTVDAREKHHATDDDDLRLWTFVEEGVFLRPLDIDSDLVEVALEIAEARRWCRRLLLAVNAHRDSRTLRAASDPCDDRLYERVLDISCDKPYWQAEL